MHKLNLGQPIEEFPNVDQFSCPTNKCPAFVRVIYDPIMLDAYWTEEQVEESDLHLGFWFFNLGGIYNLDFL